MANSVRNRRRQRSIRVTVSVILLALAAIVVAVALVRQSTMVLSIAALVALICGMATTQIVHTELAQSRRDAATDRSAQAQHYRDLAGNRSEENTAFATMMRERVADRDHTVAELGAAVKSTELRAEQQEKRAIEAETLSQSESHRADLAETRSTELEEQVGDQQVELDGLADLLGLEHRVIERNSVEQGPESQQKQA